MQFLSGTCWSLQGTSHLWLEKKYLIRGYPENPDTSKQRRSASCLTPLRKQWRCCGRISQRHFHVIDLSRIWSHLQVWWCTGALELEASVFFRTEHHVLLTNVYYHPQLLYASPMQKGEQSILQWKVCIETPSLLGRTFLFSSKKVWRNFSSYLYPTDLSSDKPKVSGVFSFQNKNMCIWKCGILFDTKENTYLWDTCLKQATKKAGKETMSMITEFVQCTVVVQNSGSELKQRLDFHSGLLNADRVPSPCWS